MDGRALRSVRSHAGAGPRPPDPIVERIGVRLNMKETVLEVPQQSVITRDNAVATVDAIVFYQVLEAAKAAYQAAISNSRYSTS
jgi:regulator of protease activity HflC (stomatin/prohibitin superfamily)